MYSKESKSVSVLASILNWNNTDLTRNCLTDLKKQTHRNLQVIVIDNDSKVDDIMGLQNEFTDLKIIKSNQNLGYAGGHELAVNFAQNCDAELIWLLNNDVSLREDTLEKLISAYLNYGGALYGSNFSNPDPLKVWKVNNSKVQFDNYVDVNTLSGEVVQVANLHGSSFLIPLEVIREFGFMDTSFFLYGEETDYCFRMLKKGIPSYIVKNSLIDHLSQGSAKKSPELNQIINYYQIRNHLVLRLKHQSFRTFLNLSFMYIKSEIYKLIRYGKLDKVVFRSIWDSWTGRRGKTLNPEDFI